MGRDAELPTLPLAPGDVVDELRGAGATYGRFVSLGVIGRGGAGVVLRARDPELDRDVALKLLAPAPWGLLDPTASQRLQREAQAMARLSHPNVVTVYEMGQVGDARFIAMELVEGTTLRRWLAQQPRTPREIVAAFVACGRGLAAAHGAGLVHRDFKPENVLIGADGRPRVTDFGLVVTRDADVDDRTMVGTPRYMAPEQWCGEEIDARTDQFGFCVALWEALDGAHPFAGTSSRELRAAVLAGRIAAPIRHAGAARRLDAILRRGLARDRAARWPSMIALLEALERPSRRRWPWAAGAVGLAGVAAVAMIVAQPARDPCPDPRSRLAGIWDAPTRDRVVAAFAAANPAIAGEVSGRVVAALDDYAARWRAAAVTACRATRTDGAQSSQLLDRRMVCLDRRRTELATLTAAFAAADHDRVAASIDATGALGDLDQCADREALLAFPLPSDPAQRRRVDALEAELTAVAGLRFADRPAERLARASAAVTAARTLDYPPLLAQALRQQHAAARDHDQHAAAEAALRELATVAAAAHDDALAAVAWIEIIQLLALRGRLDEAAGLEPVAEAAVTRAGGAMRLRNQLAISMAVRRLYGQAYDEGIALLGPAVANATNETSRAAAQQLLAQATLMRDGPAGALPLAEQSLAATEAAYGATHPRTADRLHLLAQIRSATGELDRAQAHEARALAIREAALGPAHVQVAASLHTLGNLLDTRGDDAGARRAYQRAIAILDGAADVEGAAVSRGALATLVAADEGLAGARPIFAAALDGLAGTIGRDHVNYVQTESNFAEQLVAAGACDEAAPRLAHVIAVMERVSPRLLPGPLALSARCDLAGGRVAAAIASLERGRALCAKAECPPAAPETLTWALGRTLVESRRDRRRGLALIDEAARLAAAHRVDALTREIEVWRRDRR